MPAGIEWLLYALWLLLACGALFAILIALPGGWIALALTLGYDLIFGIERIGWLYLGIFAALLALGEILESLLGTVYVARKGATVPGMIGAFAGGIAGAILGSSLLPVVGTVLGGFAGAFAGAVGGEYWKQRQLEPSLQIGLHATIGRLLSTLIKLGLALSGLLLCAVRAWPQR
jgi:uncharacterized protein YqgC (DUF456 family)